MEVALLSPEWFEAAELARSHCISGAWIPIRQDEVFLEKGEAGEVGWAEERRCAVALVVPEPMKNGAMGMDWVEVSQCTTAPQFEATKYFPAGSVVRSRPEPEEVLLHAAPCYDFDGRRPQEWYLYQDIEIALGLVRNKDTWFRPEDDYNEAARLSRDNFGRPCRLEVRKEYLQDYLRARVSGLAVLTYRHRQAVLPDNSGLHWEADVDHREVAGGRWEGRAWLDRDRLPMKIAAVSRVDQPGSDEVPVLRPPTDDNTKLVLADGSIPAFGGFFVNSQFYRNEWLGPAERSRIVLGEVTPPNVEFIVDNSDTRMASTALLVSRRWLWFRPELIVAILGRRGSLSWSTADTGAIGLFSGGALFGVNELGLITVFAKDVGVLPEHAQRIFAASNVAPDGGVAAELLASQMENRLVGTVAPETMLRRALEALDAGFETKYGGRLLSDHEANEQVLSACHRFRALDLVGATALAKDLHRAVIERFDSSLLKRLTPREPQHLGSIKRLASVLDSLGSDGRALTAPLAGINDLRQADAHLPSDTVEGAFALLGVERPAPGPRLGKTMIGAVANCITEISEAVRS